MNRWKKTFLAIKVFLPIFVKGMIQMLTEIFEAYDKNNEMQNEYYAEEIERIKENGFKQV